MITDKGQITVEGIQVELVRKKIKNLHLAVYPPDGRVRLAMPMHLDERAARLAIVTRLPWLRRKQTAVREQARETKREMVSGESHYVSGRRYLLQIEEHNANPCIQIEGNKTLRLCVRPNTSQDRRQAILDRWYRDRLRKRISELISAWSERIGVQVEDWGIKRMRTRWGSCSIQARRIWLNLELAKKSDRCLEYVVVHEMIHLIEPRHSKRFYSLMDHHLPRWGTIRDELNQGPLGGQNWDY